MDELKIKKKKRKTPRCNHKECKRKLKLTDFNCPACNLKFCCKHRYYSDHNCNKFESYNQDQIANISVNEKVIFDKVNNI